MSNSSREDTKRHSWTAAKGMQLALVAIFILGLRQWYVWGPWTV